MPERTPPRCRPPFPPRCPGPSTSSRAAVGSLRSSRSLAAALAAAAALLAGATHPALQAQTSPGSPAAKPQLERTVWVCDVAYTPTRSNWSRQVQLSYDDRRLHTVDIDGVRVYTFSVADTLILTSLDNERIRIDVGARTWSSDFRGLAEGQGRCEPADAAR